MLISGYKCAYIGRAYKGSAL